MEASNTNLTGKQATPEQQKQFDLLLGRARQIMGDSGEHWIESLKQAPVPSAVSMGTSTLRSLATMSEKAGAPVDPAVLFNVGIQFVKDIAGVANACGAVPDEQLPAFLKDVFSQSMAQYLKADAAEGKLPQGTPKGMLAQMQEPGEQPEPAGEGPGPDDMPAHENAEEPAVEQAEGSEEDMMASELDAIRKRKGGM